MERQLSNMSLELMEISAEKIGINEAHQSEDCTLGEENWLILSCPSAASSASWQAEELHRP